MLVDPDDGDRVVIRGTVTDDAGRPLAGATLDCWQNATAGFYAVQQPGVQSAENLRGIYTTDDDGTYEIRTVRPVPYPIPFDGPVGDVLRANGRGWMRPGHTHMWVKAEGCKDLITHVFDAETDYLHDDAVFGVRPSLVRAFAPDADGELAATFDIVLDRLALSKGQRRCTKQARGESTGPTSRARRRCCTSSGASTGWCGGTSTRSSAPTGCRSTSTRR